MFAYKMQFVDDVNDSKQKQHQDFLFVYSIVCLHTKCNSFFLQNEVEEL